MTNTEWVDGRYGCGDTTVVQTRTKTTTSYVIDENYEWVLDTDNSVTVTDTRTRDLIGAEQTTCGISAFPIRAIPIDPSVTAPTCDGPGIVVLPTSTVGYKWQKQTDGTYRAVADGGYFFDQAAVTTFDPGDLTQLSRVR